MKTPFDTELWASEALKFIHKEDDNPGPIIQILVCLECGHFNGFSCHVLELLKYGMIGIECGGCKKDITTGAEFAAEEYFHGNDLLKAAALRLAEIVDNEIVSGKIAL